MPYFSEQRTPGVKAKVLSAIPSVELRDGELMGCTTVRLKEPLNDVEMKALQEYLRGQFSDGWGEGFEQWEIYTEAMCIRDSLRDGFHRDPHAAGGPGLWKLRVV